MKNLKVLVLEGGYNEEHEVSLSTGREVKKSLSNLGIEYTSITVNPETFENEIITYDKEYVCFNSLHGSFGEDGKIQKILDKMKLSYTHSNLRTSNIGFNKDLTKKAIEKTAITCPKYKKITSEDLNENMLRKLFIEMGSYILKPNSSGSSFGIKIFKTQEDINFFLRDIENNIKVYSNHKEISAEEYLDGRELTVAVVEKNGFS